MMPTGDRNDDRYWYDRGYSLGVTETERDHAIPRLVGYGLVFSGALWNPTLTGVFLALFTAREILWWRDRCDEAEHKREVHDPGPTWEWQRGDER